MYRYLYIYTERRSASCGLRDVIDNIYIYNIYQGAHILTVYLRAFIVGL